MQICSIFKCIRECTLDILPAVVLRLTKLLLLLIYIHVVLVF